MDTALTLLGLTLLAISLTYLWPLLAVWARLRLHIVSVEGNPTRLHVWLTPQEREEMLTLINDSETARRYQIEPVPLMRTPAVLLGMVKEHLNQH